ncbi:MAG: type IV pilus biogenesis/stability protein PilW [Halothiobacillus sp.]|jgi:type IV pilus assembly protein PilF|nr:type IV pilus biogenesis/stability protein PilW [Halothiobacillus sp.]
MNSGTRRMFFPVQRVFVAFALTALLGGCASTTSRSGDGGPRDNQTQNERAAQINTELGVGYMHEGHMDVAVEKIRRAIYFDDNFAPAHHAYALMLNQLGETEKAGVEFAKAYSLDSNNSDLDNNYATYLCSQKDYTRAQALFARAYGDPLYKTPEFALTNSGVCYESQGQPNKAIGQYQAALVKADGYGPAILGLARVYYAEGEFSKAEAAMKNFDLTNRGSPESLQLAIRIDRATHDQQALANHVLILKGRFPDSAVTKWFESGAK